MTRYIYFRRRNVVLPEPLGIINKVSRIHLDIFLTNLNEKNWLLNDPDNNLLKQLMSSS